MTKIQVLGGCIALLTSCALAVSGASATLWLINGASLNKATTANAHGSFTLKHAKGFTGEYTLSCSGLLDGTVGPGASDSVLAVLDLKGEKNLTSCKMTSIGTCGNEVGELVDVVEEQLSWPSLLSLEGGKTIDTFSSEVGKTPTFKFLCLRVDAEVSCHWEVKSEFSKNGTNGAMFKLASVLKGCSDAGELTESGSYEVLGANVS